MHEARVSGNWGSAAGTERYAGRQPRAEKEPAAAPLKAQKERCSRRPALKRLFSVHCEQKPRGKAQADKRRKNGRVRRAFPRDNVPRIIQRDLLRVDRGGAQRTNRKRCRKAADAPCKFFCIARFYPSKQDDTGTAADMLRLRQEHSGASGVSPSLPFEKLPNCRDKILFFVWFV